MTTQPLEAVSTEDLSSVSALESGWELGWVIAGYGDTPTASLRQVSTSVRFGGLTGWEMWALTGSSVVLSTEAARRELDELYDVVQPLKVAQFMTNNPSAVPLLVEARQQIQRHFGSCAVTLDVATDPDGDDDPRLVVGIRVSLDPKLALETLDKFDLDWWLDASLRGGGKVCIALEYE